MPKPTSIHELVAWLGALLSPASMKRWGVDVDVEMNRTGAAVVRWDEAHLSTVMLELLSNAAKYAGASAVSLFAWKSRAGARASSSRTRAPGPARREQGRSLRPRGARPERQGLRRRRLARAPPRSRQRWPARLRERRARHPRDRHVHPRCSAGQRAELPRDDPEDEAPERQGPAGCQTVFISTKRSIHREATSVAAVSNHSASAGERTRTRLTLMTAASSVDLVSLSSTA